MNKAEVERDALALRAILPNPVVECLETEPERLGDLPFATARVVKRRKECRNLCKKVFGEEWHILGTIAEGVQRELKYLEPAVQIFAKFGLA